MTNEHFLEGEAQHELIIQEAQRRGIRVSDVSEEFGKKTTLLKLNNQEEYIVQGVPESWMSPKAEEYCDFKQKAKELFNKLNIPSPKSYRFGVIEDLDNVSPFSSGSTFVCKPEIGTSGVGVVFNITSREDVIDYLSDPLREAGPYLLEEFIEGEDLRLQIVGGKIVAVCIRRPAYVKGDGESFMSELISERQREIKAQNPANDLVINQESIDLIEKSAYELNDIIPKGIEIQLKEIANMGQGGIAIDITDNFDSKLQIWVDEIAEFLGTGYFAFDLIGSNHQDIDKCKALELNLRAEWMHHTFSENRVHDLAKTVINELFPLVH